MKRYLAKLVFNVTVENSNNTSEFDEQIRIVEAHNSEGAFYKARNVGRKEEESFFDNNNNLVNWSFIDVADIYPLDDIKDGEQIYSTTHKTKDNVSFINYVRQKSMEIQAKNLTFA